MFPSLIFSFHDASTKGLKHKYGLYNCNVEFNVNPVGRVFVDCGASNHGGLKVVSKSHHICKGSASSILFSPPSPALCLHFLELGSWSAA